MHLAGRVADDERRAVVSLRLGQRLDRLVHIGAHRNVRDIDIAVGHRDLRQVLLADGLAGRSKLRDLADVGGLRSLSAGVGIHLGVEDHDVHIHAGRDHVIQAAEADIIRPAVAAEDPVRLLCKELLVFQELRAALAGSILLQFSDKRLRSSGVRLAVVLRGEVRLASRLLFRICRRIHQLFDTRDESLADRVVTQRHAQAVLGVVLEEAVCPRRAMAGVLVDSIRRRGSRAAPDGRAAGRVGNKHPLAEELRDQTRIRRLRAASAGARELKQRLVELAALDGVLRHHAGLLGDIGNRVVERRLLVGLRLLRLHDKRLLLCRAYADADAAAHAVERADAHREEIILTALALHLNGLHRSGALRSLILRQSERADGGVRAHIRALVALDAVFRDPGGNVDRDAALLISRGALLERTVDIIHKCADRQAVAVHLADRLHNLFDHLDELRLTGELDVVLRILSIRPGSRNVYLHKRRDARVDCRIVHVDDGFALLGIGLVSRFLHILHSVFDGKNLRQCEEARLKDGVRPLAHTDLTRLVDRVDDIKLNVVLGDIALRFRRHVVVELFRRPLAVDKERAARLDVAHHLVALYNIRGVVACDKVGLIDIIRRLDGLIAKTQVRDGDAARLLAVVLEISLDIFVGMVADDLRGVLVRADGAVAAEAPELAFNGAGRRRVRCGLLLEGEVRHIVVDADGEARLRRILGKLLIHRKHACRRGILRAEAVAAADDLLGDAGIRERGDDVEVQRLAEGAGLLRAVEDCDLLCRGRDRFDQLVRTERAVQADLDDTDLLAFRAQVVDDFFRYVADRAHRDDHAVGIRRAVIVEELIVGADLGIDFIHIFFDNGRNRVVELVACLTMLEEDVAVLVRAAQHRALRVERTLAERFDRVVIDHLVEILEIPHFDLLNLVRGAEAVEEVQERHAALDRGKVCHSAEVHHFLRVRLGKHRKAGLAACVNVAVVAENVERVGRERTGRDMEYARQQLACDFIHVRDHEKKALGCGVGRRQRTGGKAAVHGACGARLRLHLHDFYFRTEDVLHVSCGPYIDLIGHRAGRRDRVNAGNFRKGVAYMRRSGIAIHGFLDSWHFGSSLITYIRAKARGNRVLPQAENKARRFPLAESP